VLSPSLSAILFRIAAISFTSAQKPKVLLIACYINISLKAIHNQAFGVDSRLPPSTPTTCPAERARRRKRRLQANERDGESTEKERESFSPHFCVNKSLACWNCCCNFCATPLTLKCQMPRMRLGQIKFELQVGWNIKVYGGCPQAKVHQLMDY